MELIASAITTSQQIKGKMGEDITSFNTDGRPGEKTATLPSQRALRHLAPPTTSHWPTMLAPWKTQGRDASGPATSLLPERVHVSSGIRHHPSLPPHTPSLQRREVGVHGKRQEEAAPHCSDGALGDAQGQQAAAHHCEAGAHNMAQGSAHCHTQGVLVGGKLGGERG